jgi:hypothetical protein
VAATAAVTGCGLGFGRDEEWGGDGSHAYTLYTNTGINTNRYFDFASCFCLVSVSIFGLSEAGEPKGLVIVSFLFYCRY